MQGVYLKIRESICVRDHEVRVRKYMYSTDETYTDVPQHIDQSEVENGYRFMKCKFCGHHDFREDGINSYNCNGCDAEIVILS